MSDECKLKVGRFEITIGDIEDSILIEDTKKELLAIRINPQYSQNLFSDTACFPPEVFKDEVMYEIKISDPQTGNNAGNKIYVGKSGHFYQWGNCKPLIDDSKKR